jgi:hypothetical protein
MWPWEASLTPGGKSGRYLLSNRELDHYQGDSLGPAQRFGEINVYETVGWKPRLETRRSEGPETANPPASACPDGYSKWSDLCAVEPRDGNLRVTGAWTPGDTLVFRERFDAGWQVRVGQGPWQSPRETSEHFQALVFGSLAEQAEWRYRPSGFFRLLAFSAGATALGAVFYKLFRLLMRFLGR